MRAIGKSDLVAGLLAFGFGAAVVVHVRSFPQLPGGQPGPALFPGIVGALLVIFGLALVAQSLRAGAHREERAVDAAGEPAGQPSQVPPSRRRAIVNAVAVLAAIVVYILVADVLGFVPTMVVLLFGLMWWLGTRPWVAVVAAIATAFVVALVFRQILLVPLPQGPLGL